MKSKKLDKKLVLGKKTVVDLNNSEMVEIQAGEASGMTCPHCAITTYSRCLSVCGGAAC